MIAWIRRRLHRRMTIAAIVSEWRWSREAATHAVDVWGFNPWEPAEAGKGRRLWVRPK